MLLSCVAKVIPDDEWIESVYRNAIATEHLKGHAAKLIEAAEEKGKGVELPDRLREQIVDQLKEDPKMSWDEAVIRTAQTDYIDESE